MRDNAPVKRALVWLVVAVTGGACSSVPASPPRSRAEPTASAVRSSPPTAPIPSVVPTTTPAAADVLPGPNKPIPRDAATLATTLRGVTADLHRAIDEWTTQGDPSRGRAPDAVVLRALYQQRIYRSLARNHALARRTLPLLPSSVRREAHANITAAAELFSIVRPISHPSRFNTGPPKPAGMLLRWFRQAQSRFGVDWELLAAVMYVESKFGRVRSASTAGAQGPMQFIPSTWGAYGMGGNVHDPHDAILGAANYLHRSGAPTRERQALFAYNQSSAYVNAVMQYTNQMRRDPRTFYAYYNWQVFVLTTSGDRRLTGPGL